MILFIKFIKTRLFGIKSIIIDIFWGFDSNKLAKWTCLQPISHP